MRTKFANEKYVSDYYLKINFKETKTKTDIFKGINIYIILKWFFNSCK